MGLNLLESKIAKKTIGLQQKGPRAFVAVALAGLVTSYTSNVDAQICEERPQVRGCSPESGPLNPTQRIIRDTCLQIANSPSVIRLVEGSINDIRGATNEVGLVVTSARARADIRLRIEYLIRTTLEILSQAHDLAELSALFNVPDPLVPYIQSYVSTFLTNESNDTCNNTRTRSDIRATQHVDDLQRMLEQYRTRHFSSLPPLEPRQMRAFATKLYLGIIHTPSRLFRSLGY